jgi:hypothetical protein
VSFEIVEALGPEGAVVREPFVDVGERLGAQRV